MRVLRVFLIACALVLGGVAAVAGTAYFVWRSNELRVAIPASNTLDQRVFGMAAELLRAQRSTIRIEVVAVENTAKAMEALETNKVKLAVVRSDAAMQGRTHSVMIMRREAAVLIAPKVGKVQKIADLQNVTIGLVRDGPQDNRLLQPVLEYYGLKQDAAKYVRVATDDIANAFRQKRVDALIVVGAIASRQMGDIVADAARGVKGAIQFIDIEEADAIVKRIPALESVEVEQGAFGGRPPRPEESFNTLGYSIRLVTNTKTDGDTIAELMRQLYLVRQNIATAVPGAGLMEAPATDEATAFLIHPGVRAYVNGEQRSWFDRYSDYIYLGMFLGSGLGSVAAGMFGWMGGGGSGRELKMPVERIEAALDAVRDAHSPEDLAKAEKEADEIFRLVFGMGVAGKLPDAGVASFGMAMTELRERIAVRRSELAARHTEVPPPG